MDTTPLTSHPTMNTPVGIAIQRWTRWSDGSVMSIALAGGRRRGGGWRPRSRWPCRTPRCRSRILARVAWGHPRRGPGAIQDVVLHPLSVDLQERPLADPLGNREPVERDHVELGRSRRPLAGDARRHDTVSVDVEPDAAGGGPNRAGDDSGIRAVPSDQPYVGGQRLEAVDRPIAVVMSEEGRGEADVGPDVEDDPWTVEPLHAVHLAVEQAGQVGDVAEVVSQVQKAVDGLDGVDGVGSVPSQMQADPEILRLVPQDGGGRPRPGAEGCGGADVVSETLKRARHAPLSGRPARGAPPRRSRSCANRRNRWRAGSARPAGRPPP